MNYDFPEPRVLHASAGYASFLAMLSPDRWTVIGQWSVGDCQLLPSIYPDDVILAANKNDAIVMHRHGVGIVTIEARIMGPMMRRFVERQR